VAGGDRDPDFDHGETHTADATAPACGAPATRRLVDRYLVIDELGVGGMGAVYRAYDPELARLVALKLLLADGRRAGHGLRLRREAQAAARLAHPNVVAIYDVGSAGDELYVAMELVEGVSLHAWLRQRRRNLSELLEVFTQAARGLAAAHDQNLVHRDFKPANVLVGGDGRVRVADFGLARAADLDDEVDPPAPGSLLDHSLTRTGHLVGTPRYMAPEQLRGAADSRSDQFAFCVTLYEALAGKRPFAGRDYRELFRNVKAGKVVPLPDDAAAPAWLRALVMRGLSVDPDDRFPTMHALIDELTRDRLADRRATLDGTSTAEPMIAAFPLPDDARTAARVRELQGELERAWAHKRDGDFAAALALARSVTGAAHQVDYLPLRAAALYTLGNLQHRTGASRAARETLYLAAQLAAAAGDDWQVANSWVFLITVLAQGLDRFDEAETIARVAEVAIARLGDNPALSSRLYVGRGATLLRAGRPAEAVRPFDLALALDERTHGPGHPLLVISLLGLAEAQIAAGEPEPARRHLARARAICERVAPRLAPSLARVAELERRL
jgi:tetratricopeptide (TPR) repeat protein